MPTQMNEIVRHLRRAVLRQEEAGLTDGQLLDRFIEHRDEAAVAALVLRHGPMVWGVCRRVLGNHHDTEDAFQATFLVLVRKAGSVRQREMVGNWLYGVAHQTAMKARAMLEKRRARQEQVTDLPETEAPQEDACDDLQPMLDLELSRLPDKYRVAIVLCDLEGKTRKEAALQLGLPEGTMAGRLTRGRAMLAKRLARHRLAVTGIALGMVPTSLVSSTLEAVTLVAAGRVATVGVISFEVASLTNGVLKAMSLSKLTIAATVLLAASALSIGAGVLVLSSQGAEQPRSRPQPASQGSTQKAAQEKKAEGLPAEVVAAWQKAGAEVGWMGPNRQHPSILWSFTSNREQLVAARAVPTFKIRVWREGMWAKLPAPAQAFGLNLTISGLTDEGLKELASLKQLTSLYLYRTKVTDVGLKELAPLTQLTSLGLDSLAFIEYTFELEKALHVVQPDPPRDMVTVGDLARFVEREVSGQAKG